MGENGIGTGRERGGKWERKGWEQSEEKGEMERERGEKGIGTGRKWGGNRGRREGKEGGVSREKKCVRGGREGFIN